MSAAEDLRERIAWLRDRWYKRPGLNEQADALDAALEESREARDEELERVRAERDELKTAIAMVRADCRRRVGDQPPADPEHTTWLAGTRAQATRVLNILTALGIPESGEGES